MLLSIPECPSPPEGSLSTTTVDYSYQTGVFWSGTNVTYTCVEGYSFKYNQPEVLTCRRDGTWSQETAPECRQSLFILSFKAHILSF